MKLAVLILSATVAIAASAYADSTAPKGAYEHGASPPCCDTGGKAYQASGTVKRVDPATGTVTVAHGAVKDLNWPAMTMTFKVKDKALLDTLAVDRKIKFTFVPQGKNYVITTAQ